MQFPRIIQGGMGVGVSNWKLAQAVSRLGQLGVVSGTALDTLFVRRLADGDKDGAMRRGVEAFPFPETARRIWNEYFVHGGKQPDKPYPALPVHQKKDTRKLVELCMVSNFVEVFLAREGHKNPVGINYLEKVQTPHLASIYGAMLAGVSYVLMGAGIPLHIPGILDNFAALHPAEYRLSVAGASQTQDVTMRLDPAEIFGPVLPTLQRPKFLAIISSNVLAQTMVRRANGHVDGFIVEGPTAGGHNAPPRGKGPLSETGQPVYGEKDRVNLAELSKLGLPFWLAGGYGAPEKVAEALSQGAAGVQVGTVFAFSDESGLQEDLKRSLLAQAIAGKSEVFTDPLASPTGFPFKVAVLEGTESQFPIYQRRRRVCDIGLLREAYSTGENSIGYRCSAEPEENFVSKGGSVEETVGRKCLCNSLLANVGYAQVQKDGSIEPALVTVGDDLGTIVNFLAPGRTSYTAAEVVEKLLSRVAAPKVELAVTA
jgi:nitronate monooxygenase